MQEPDLSAETSSDCPEPAADRNRNSASKTGSDVGADRGTVEVALDIDADLDAVWRGLVTDGGLEPWMGDGATIDPQPGGRLTVPDVVGGRPRAGRVEVVDERSALTFTWWPMTRPTDRSTVAITIVSIETGTRITVRETRLRRSTAVLSSVGHGAVWPSTTEPAATEPTGFGPSMTGRSGPGTPEVVRRGLWAWRLALFAVSYQVARV